MRLGAQTEFLAGFWSGFAVKTLALWMVQDQISYTPFALGEIRGTRRILWLFFESMSLGSSILDSYPCYAQTCCSWYMLLWSSHGPNTMFDSLSIGHDEVFYINTYPYVHS